MMTSDSSTRHPPSQTAQSLHLPYQPAPRLRHHLIGSLQLMHHKQWTPQQLLLPDPTNVNPMFSTPLHMYTSHGPSKIPTLQRLWSHWYLQAQLHPLHEQQGLSPCGDFKTIMPKASWNSETLKSTVLGFGFLGPLKYITK